MTTSRSTADWELREIDLYLPEDSSGSDIGSIEKYLGEFFPTVKIKLLPPVFRGLKGTRLEACSVSLASSRVKDPLKRTESAEPMYGEVDYERRAILGKARVGGVVYDGQSIQRMCLDLLKAHSSLDRCSIVFTERLLSTYSQDEMRHHLRMIVCGFPTLVSIPGIVEAPAKPREYYFMRQQLEAVGASEQDVSKLKSAFKGRFVDYGKQSVNEVLKGLALQAVMYHITLNPFCDDRTCRLFNAHWQEELIESQVKSARLCAHHAKLVKRLGKHPRLSW